MKIILLKDVQKLGKRHEVKTVSDGHAINLLIPQGLAITATVEAMKRLEIQNAQAEAERKIQEELLAKNLEQLGKAVLTISGKANAKGHLFAGLHSEAIASALASQARLAVDPSFIVLENPIKETGEHMIEVRAAGKSVKFKLVVQKA